MVSGKSIAYCVAAAVFFLCGVVHVSASPVEWTFVDVRFSDGGTLEGSFIYDSERRDPTRILEYSLRTYGGSSEIGPWGFTYPGGYYRDYMYYGIKEQPPSISVINFDQAPDGTMYWIAILYLYLEEPFTNNGGTIDLYTALHPEGDYPAEYYLATDGRTPIAKRTITRGRIRGVPVPAPASILCLMAGLFALASLRIRRRKT